MALGADDVGALLKRRLQEAVVFIAVETVANLVEATPVDLGWARANWRASIGVPLGGTVGQRPQRARKGSGGLVARMAANAGAAAAVARYKLGQGGIFITNNVPYINRLRRGWSSQAPAGWVDRSIERALARARAVFGRMMG